MASVRHSASQNSPSSSSKKTRPTSISSESPTPPALANSGTSAQKKTTLPERSPNQSPGRITSERRRCTPSGSLPKTVRSKRSDSQITTDRASAVSYSRSQKSKKLKVCSRKQSALSQRVSGDIMTTKSVCIQGVQDAPVTVQDCALGPGHAYRYGGFWVKRVRAGLQHHGRCSYPHGHRPVFFQKAKKGGAYHVQHQHPRQGLHR